MDTVELRRTMFASRLLRSLQAFGLALCVICLIGSAAIAQDPFANPGTSNSSATNSTNNAAQSDNSGGSNDPQDQQDDTDAIVTAIRQSNPSSASELADAIAMMMDINRDDAARSFLNKLSNLSLDDEAWHEFHRKQGPAFLVRLQMRDGLQPAGRDFANKVFSITRKLTTDPARLKGLVDKVVNGMEREKIEAARELTTIGPAGAAALMQVFADPGKSDSHPTIHALVRSMGSGAEPVLYAAARSGNVSLQKAAISLLVELNRPSGFEVLIGLKARSKNQAELADPVDAALTRLSLNNVSDIKLRKSLNSFIERYLDDDQANAIEQSEYRDIWIWDANSQVFVRKTVATNVLRRSKAADFADDLLAIEQSNTHSQYLSLLSRVEANRLIIGLDQPASSLQQIGFADNVDPNMLKKVLSGALERDLVGAAVASCDAYGILGNDIALQSNQGRPSPLARALSHGNPRIRAAAAKAIIQIDPHKSFAGSSQFIQTLVYLSGTMGYSKAMIAHGDATQAQTFAAGIGRSGMVSQSVNTSRDCFRDATQDSDFEIIFVTDTLDYPDYAELVQQLRHDSRTKQIPIGLLARPQNMHRAELVAAMDKHMLALPWTRSPGAIAKYIDRLRKLGPQAIEPIQRTNYGKIAMDALEKYAADPGQYPMYNLQMHQEEIASALLSPVYGEQACDLLGNLGTAYSQSQLINLANQSDLPLETRAKAVQAFTKAVRKNGVLLTSVQIKMQQRRRDATRFDEQDNLKILEDILNVIENR